MASNKVSFRASAGFMPFNLSDLAELWGNLKDGNYFSAFKRAIKILNDTLNPTVGTSIPLSWKPDIEGTHVDEICDKIEQWRDEASLEPEDFQRPAELSEPNAGAVPIGEIIMIVNLVLDFVREWRRRRNPTPTVGGQPDAVKNREQFIRNVKMTNPEQLASTRPVEPARPTQPPVTNPSDGSGETLDPEEERQRRLKAAKGETEEVEEENDDDDTEEGKAKGAAAAKKPATPHKPASGGKTTHKKK